MNLGMVVLLLSGETVQVAVRVGRCGCRRRIDRMCMVKVELLLLQVVRRWEVGWLKVGRIWCVGETSRRAEGATGAADAGDRPEGAAV